VRVESFAAVDPDRAWAWWTDFREGAEDHVFVARARPRRRVEELEPGHLRMRDEASILRIRWREETDAWLRPPRVEFDVRNPAGRFRGHYAFLPAEGGVRVEVELAMDPRWWLRALGPLGAWMVRRFVAWDLRMHLREMERDVGRAL
jgi:hypothetical protein